ncbi:hypothetical protein FOZ63_009473, partial [Perkinsus olseni]
PSSMSSTSSLTPSGLHIISLADNTPVILGRGHESQVRITDVSISRKHASIRYENGHVWIQDLMSKFGTLVSVRGGEVPLPSDGAPTAIQVGRTLFSLSCVPSVKLPASFDVDDAKGSFWAGRSGELVKVWYGNGDFRSENEFVKINHPTEASFGREDPRVEVTMVFDK